MDPKKTDAKRYALNMTLATVAGQVGCLTIIIVFLALFAGLWLDNHFGTRPLFIIGLLVFSVPVTVIVMFWVARQATARIKSPNSTERSREDSDIGTQV